MYITSLCNIFRPASSSAVGSILGRGSSPGPLTRSAGLRAWAPLLPEAPVAVDRAEVDVALLLFRFRLLAETTSGLAAAASLLAGAGSAGQGTRTPKGPFGPFTVRPS